MHVHGLARDDLCRDDTFLFGLVREQFAAADVTDRVHVWQIRALLVIDDDLAALTHRETKYRRIDAVHRRFAADGDEHVIAVERRRRAILLDVNRHAVRTHVRANDLRARVNRKSLLAEDLVRFLHQLVVGAWHDRRCVLDDRDARTKTAPYRAEFEANHAAADDDQVRGHFGNRERADVR